MLLCGAAVCPSCYCMHIKHGSEGVLAHAPHLSGVAVGEGEGTALSARDGCLMQYNFVVQLMRKRAAGDAGRFRVVKPGEGGSCRQGWARVATCES